MTISELKSIVPDPVKPKGVLFSPVTELPPTFIEVDQQDIYRAIDAIGKAREYIEQNIKEFKETNDLSLIRNKTWKRAMEKDLEEMDLAFFALKRYPLERK